MMVTSIAPAKALSNTRLPTEVSVDYFVKATCPLTRYLDPPAGGAVVSVKSIESTAGSVPLTMVVATKSVVV